ncbi:MAG: nucleotidyltransferase family protein [Terracidiphilus sp.]
MNLPAIILAAGASRRLGRPKQLLDLDGETLLARTIRVARESGADPVLVVLGADAHLISASVPMNEVITVLNPEWQEGMASSVRAGVRSLLSCVPDASGAILLVCDQPRLSAAHIRALIESFRQSSESAAVASTYSGTRGIPAIFPRLLFLRLLALTGDKGARNILADPQCPIVEAPFAGGEIDIDSPADIDRLKESSNLL